MSSKTIPLSFIRERKELTWREMELGFQEGWLAPDAVVSFAIGLIESGSEDADVAELASLFRTEHHQIDDILARLASREPKDIDKGIYLTWMRILLAWIYEHRSSFRDPLGLVEEIYADFDYPTEIRHLVRYMPTERAMAPGEHGEAALMRHWAEYVAEYVPLLDTSQVQE